MRLAARGELCTTCDEREHNHRGSTAVDPRALTVTFNEHINNRELPGLAALMTDDHTFIDTAGHTIRGKSKCLAVARILHIVPRLSEHFRLARR